MRIAVLVVGVVVPIGLVVALGVRVEWFFVVVDIGRLTLLGRLDDLGWVCGSTPLTPRWSSCFGVGGRCLLGSSVLRIGHCTCGFDLESEIDLRESSM